MRELSPCGKRLANVCQRWGNYSRLFRRLFWAFLWNVLLELSAWILVAMIPELITSTRWYECSLKFIFCDSVLNMIAVSWYFGCSFNFFWLLRFLKDLSFRRALRIVLLKFLPHSANFIQHCWIKKVKSGTVFLLSDLNEDSHWVQCHGLLWESSCGSHIAHPS